MGGGGRGGGGGGRTLKKWYLAPFEPFTVGAEDSCLNVSGPWSSWTILNCGWVGGWVGELLSLFSLCIRKEKEEEEEEEEEVGGWVGG